MERLEKLDDADYIDLKYDAISQKFEASIFWGPGEKVWSETLEGNGDVEIGVMGVEKGIEEDELKLAGFIYEIGESKDFGALPWAYSSVLAPFPFSTVADKLSPRTNIVLIPFPPPYTPFYLHPHHPAAHWSSSSYPYFSPRRPTTTSRRVHSQCPL